MGKESYYFPHDYNAIQDPKMMMVLSECGLSGIAIYWIIIEILHQQDEGKISEDSLRHYIKFYASFDRNRSGEQMLNKIEEMLIKSGLLLNKDGIIYSERVLKNKEYRSEISQKRSIAGKKSAELRLNSTYVEHLSTNDEQGKERKGKEIKRKENINRVFVEPKIEEIVNYCIERNNKVDPEAFLNFYESKGWMVGKNKMKDWKAAIRTWEKNGYGNSNTTGKERSELPESLRGLAK